MAIQKQQPRQLSDAERKELAEKLDIKTLDIKSETLGFKIRGQDLSIGAVVAKIPESLADADVSVCGVKGFMIDETRVFTRPDGSREAVDCAAVAALDIVDSPVHVHGYTQEVYVILGGSGEMLLGENVFNVQKGNVILIPPQVEHGLLSDSEEPVKTLLTFTPGLAPKTQPDFRDEKIVYERTSERIQQLQGR